MGIRTPSRGACFLPAQKLGSLALSSGQSLGALAPPSRFSVPPASHRCSCPTPKSYLAPDSGAEDGSGFQVQMVKLRLRGAKEEL